MSLSAIQNPFSNITLETGKISPHFGAYSLEDNQPFDEWISAKKTQRIALSILLGTLSVGILSLFFIPTLYASSYALIIVVIQLVALSLLILFILQSVLEYRMLGNLAPPTNLLGLDQFQSVAPGQIVHANYGIAFENSSLSTKAKLELIREEEDSIILCGCYCGGDKFQEVLEIIQDKFQKNSLNEVYIISSDFFLTAENENLLEQIASEFPEKFFYRVAPEFNLNLSTQDLSWKLTVPHVKALITGRGRDVIVGGSGIADPWTREPGTAHKGEIQFLASVHNDIDHYFYSDTPNKLGTTMYLEMLRLFALQKYPEDPKIFQRWINEPPRLNFQPRSPFSFTEDVKSYDNNDLRCKIFATGPENKANALLDELIDLINRAEKKIWISHLYFHPCDSLIDALRQAANRGVEITLVTNSSSAQSPICHQSFVEFSRSYYDKLLSEETQENVKIYEYIATAESLHTKIITIDDRILITGSANISYKSLEGLADYELTLVVESEELVNSTQSALENNHFNYIKKVSLDEIKSRSPLSKILGLIQSKIKYFL